MIKLPTFKKIVFKTPKIGLKQKMWLLLSICTLSIGLLTFTGSQVLDMYIEWNKYFYLDKQDVLQVRIQAPIAVKTRQSAIPMVVIVKEQKDVSRLTSDLKDEKKEIADYIVQKFGDHAELALSIAKAESGLDCNAYNANTNGTIDIGIFQLNTVHLRKGYTLADFSNCKKNVDIAYDIFKAQGFNPWVAYTTGRYVAFYN